MNQTDAVKILSRTMLFQDVEEEKIAFLVSENIGRIKKYRKKEIVIRAGELVDAVSVVLKGTVLVSYLGKDGKESTVHVLKERKTIGLEFVRQSGGESVFDYIAVTDVELYAVPQKSLLDKHLLGEKTADQLLQNLLSLMQHENLRQHQKLHMLSLGTLRNKLMAFLYYEYLKTNSPEFDISFNRDHLAAYLCVNRSALSRELGRMEKAGLIRTKGRHFVILDLESLKEKGTGPGKM